MALDGCGPAANYFNRKGAELFSKKDLAAAKDDFQKAVRFAPGEPSYHNNLGFTLYSMKDYLGAESEFITALKDGPGTKLERQIHINQSVLYGERTINASDPRFKDWNDKEIRVLQGLLASEESNAEFHMRLGFAYFRAANPGGGFSELDQAVRLANPGEVAKYSPDPVQGSLLILRQVQQFYAKVHYFKKVHAVQKMIDQLEKPRTKS